MVSLVGSLGPVPLARTTCWPALPARACRLGHSHCSGVWPFLGPATRGEEGSGCATTASMA
eukprot:314137-Prorocentrum_lima.AAC.1